MEPLRSKKLFFICALVSLVIISGCSSKPVTKNIPKTALQAGIKTCDSKTCEDCHLDPDKISSYEKPKQVSTGGETKGG